MTWFLFADGRRHAIAPEVGLQVGRAQDCDVVVHGERISRVHLVVGADDTRWRLRDVSSNGTYTAAGRIRSLAGDAELVVALGSPHGPLLALSADPDFDVRTLPARAGAIRAQDPAGPEGAGAPRPAAPGVPWGHRLSGPEGTRVRLGRLADNDVVLPSLLASGHHAMLVRTARTWQVLDLRSARGTYVNGERTTGADLSPGDGISLGGDAFTFTGDALLPRAPEGGMAVAAEGITVQVGGATLLHPVSFRAEPRTVTAVIGPSGSGKSTLLNAMTGLRPASAGRVLVDDGDFYARYEEMRFWVGSVPQADLVPAQLRVREALGFAAALRFPAETTAPARAARVEEVIGELGLGQRADLRIDRLSGGQRKRVSVALELLTKPQILYLDEPTSGLDPGLDRQVMMLLRELADGGRTVFVVTHAVDNLALADRLIVLAAGGWLAYDGPPDAVCQYFKVPDMPSVFLALEATPGEQWAARWAGAGAPHRSPGAAAATAPVPASHPVPRAFSKPVGGLSQLPTLIRRSLRVILADPGYVGFLTALPVILGLAGALVGSVDGLGPGSGPGGLNPEARSILLVIVLGSIFTGCATTIQELVKERVIYQRERAVGLSRWAYVLSKAVVLGTIAFGQGLVFTLLTLAGRPGPADPLVLPAHLEIAVVGALATLCAAMMGLAVSALLPTREVAMPVLVVLTIVAIILSGAIPLRADWVVDWVGWATAANWQFSAMAASSDLGRLLGPASPGQGWPHQVSEYAEALGVLGLMSLAFLALAMLLTGRHDPGRSR